MNRLMGAEKFWSKVSETRGDPDNLYPWNFARIRLSAASGATKNVKRETAGVYAVCGDRKVGLLSRFRSVRLRGTLIHCRSGNIIVIDRILNDISYYVNTINKRNRYCAIIIEI